MENPETYYRDHWLTIDQERFEAYDKLFRWRPEMDPLLAPANLASGQTVLDYGCGPGWMAIELARRVGAQGHVHAADVNDAFLALAQEHAAAEEVRERMSFHLLVDDRLPLGDASLDRVVSKNVFEYVGDLHATLLEMRRMLRPGGRLHVIDSDWGMLAVEPLGEKSIAELFAAASFAYKTPLIGRKLYGALRAAGFRDLRVQVLASADIQGHFAPVVFNMASYARASGRMDPSTIDRLLGDLRASIERGTYLLVLPQFLVTGIA
ncbi:MAG TPA: methyltransferase domain-containing protein [Candidatus Binatia bacterium]|nr:methyltransferase domain-containing protein [Candidatus Binatia bacterium]